MSKTAFILLMVIMGMQASAQSSNTPPRKETKRKEPIARPNKIPVVYLSLSTGLNNNVGLLGFTLDVAVDKNISVEGGAGISSWGDKLFIGGKYYLEPNHRGWAFGTGITYSTGIQNYQANMNTIYGTEQVQLNLHAQTNILFAAYKYWNLGRRYNRCYLELGWSVPLTTKGEYDQTEGDPLTTSSNNVLKLIAPGGVIAGFGFSFTVH